MRKITVIGVGPGHMSYIAPVAAQAIKDACVIIGGKRHLEGFASPGQEQYIISNNLNDIVEVIRKRRDDGVAVLATGDPGLYGVLNFLKKYWGPEEIEVIPGVSSVQLAFARLCLPWHDAQILSAHGRPAEGLAKAVGFCKKAAILAGPDNPPENLFAMLDSGKSHRKYYFCFDLSLPTETIVELAPGYSYPEEYKGRHNCVMVIVND